MLESGIGFEFSTFEIYILVNGGGNGEAVVCDNPRCGGSKSGLCVSIYL